MKIDIYPTRHYIEDKAIKDKTLIVIDVLRATSTIIRAIHNGCREVIPTSEIEEAVNISKNYEKDSFVLGGERDAEKIEGFHLSNSPWEYSREKVEGKTVLFTTTNGTKTITKTGNIGDVLIASFTNIGAICERVVALGKDTAIICAGTLGKFSMEDILAAGALIHGLYDLDVSLELDDLAITAEFMYNSYKGNLHEVLNRTYHYSVLKGMELQRDLDDCLTIDATDVVPIYCDGIVK